MAAVQSQCFFRSTGAPTYAGPSTRRRDPRNVLPALFRPKRIQIKPAGDPVTRVTGRDKINRERRKFHLYSGLRTVIGSVDQSNNGNKSIKIRGKVLAVRRCLTGFGTRCDARRVVIEGGRLSRGTRRELTPGPARTPLDRV